MKEIFLFLGGFLVSRIRFYDKIMIDLNTICNWIAELILFLAALLAFVYGMKHFFKRGKALYLQSITMAMGCYSFGSLYNICYMLTNGAIYDGFTPAYLGHAGFFLFLLAASYGQMDRIVDDGSKAFRPARYLALLAPLLAMALLVLNLMMDNVSVSAKFACTLIWIPASLSLYFSVKHAIVPDLDFGFVKAIKPYSVMCSCMGFAELFLLTAWMYDHPIFRVLAAVVFSVLCIATILAAKKGVSKWTI